MPRILKWAIPLSIVALLAYGFYTGGVDRWRESMVTWVLVTGTLSAVGALAALGHPLTIASAFVAAPLTTLHPLLAAGWFAGLVQAWIKSPDGRGSRDARPTRSPRCAGSGAIR